MTRLLTAAALCLLLGATPVLAADQPDAGTGHARVAGGTIVDKAPSQRTAAEWAKQRPNYEALKPRLHPDR